MRYLRTYENFKVDNNSINDILGLFVVFIYESNNDVLFGQFTKLTKYNNTVEGYVWIDGQRNFFDYAEISKIGILGVFDKFEDAREEYLLQRSAKKKYNL